MGANGYETKAFTLIVYIRILIPWAVRDIDRTVPFQANSAPTSLRKCRQTSSISLFVLHSLMHPFCFRILRLLTKAQASSEGYSDSPPLRVLPSTPALLLHLPFQSRHFCCQWTQGDRLDFLALLPYQRVHPDHPTNTSC